MNDSCKSVLPPLGVGNVCCTIFASVVAGCSILPIITAGFFVLLGSGEAGLELAIALIFFVASLFVLHYVGESEKLVIIGIIATWVVFLLGNFPSDFVFNAHFHF